MGASYVSPALIERLVAYLVERGVDVTALAARVGLDASQFADPGALFPFEQGLALFDAARTHLSLPTLGLEVAMQAGFRNYGVSGFVLANHPTLAGGMREIAQLTNAMVPDLSFEIEETDDTIRLTMVTSTLWPGAHESIHELLASLYRRGLEITEGWWSPIEVHLMCDEVDRARFEEVFRAPVTFSAPANTLVFHRSDLERAVAGANPTLLVHMREAVQAQIARRREKEGAEERVIRLDGCELDLRRGEVRRKGSATHLTTKEQAILRYLAERANTTVSHEELEANVWGIGSQVISHAPAVAIRRLRAKIERDPSTPVNLVTVFGEGWKLTVPQDS